KKTADSNRQNNVLAFRVNPKGPLFLGRVENPSESPRQPVQKSEQELPKPEAAVNPPAKPPTPSAADTSKPSAEQPKAEGSDLPDLYVDQNNSGWGRNGGGLYSDTVAFWTSIVNRGRVAARDVVVSLYLNGKKLAEEVLEVLSPGSRALISKMAPGTKDQVQEMKVIIDEEGKIPDSDRLNNTATFRTKGK
ncbi:MAG: hypothetical protein HYU64_15540, partial [Armatimonadetes bacterium]|nr:hypothetical protein [Armatimonadota bacterium]